MTVKRDVGEMGESLLKVWAAQVGVTANKVSQDRSGWDFILEFPRDDINATTDGVVLDRTSRPLTCFVQVKSTDQKPRKWDVKLDNWERFAKNPFPCFFLFLEFDHQNDCQQAYLVHVWEEEIRAVLQRLRQLSVRRDKEIHKVKLSARYGSAHLLESLDGNALVKAIKTYVLASPEEYTRKKDSLVQTVGYEQGGSVAHFTILPPQQPNLDVGEFLVDFSLGLIPHLEIQSGYITDVRFGIPALEPTTILERGILTAERQPAGSGRILLRSGNGLRSSVASVQNVLYSEAL